MQRKTGPARLAEAGPEKPDRVRWRGDQHSGYGPDALAALCKGRLSLSSAASYDWKKTGKRTI